MSSNNLSRNTTGMEERLRRIHLNQKKNDTSIKKDWYKVGKALLRGEKVRLHKESQVGARRTYRFYTISKGNWDGPSPRALSKIRKSRFEELLQQRENEAERYRQDIENFLNGFDGFGFVDEMEFVGPNSNEGGESCEGTT